MPPSAAAYMAHHVEKHDCFVSRRDWISFSFGMTSFPRSSIERLPIFQGLLLRNHSLKSTPALTFNKFMVFVFSFSYSGSSVNRGSPSAIRGNKRGSGDLAWCHFLCSPGEEKCFPSYHGLWQAMKALTFREFKEITMELCHPIY